MGRKSNGTGHLRKRANGTWEGQYVFEGAKKSIYGTDYAEVRAKLNTLCANIINNTHIEESITTLGEWLTFWLETYSKPVIRHSTYISYETYIRAHVIPEIGQVKLKNLSIDVMQKFFNDKAKGGRLDNVKGGLSSKTIRNIRNMLHMALEQAITNEMIAKNVVKGIRLQRGKKKEIHVLSIPEQRKLEDAVAVTDEILPQGISIMLNTGMRLGELLALRWSDVDLDEGCIQIRSSIRRQSRQMDILNGEYIMLSEKEENKTILMLGQVKTTKGNRTVYLPERAITALEKIKDNQDEMKHIAGRYFNKMDFVFCTEAGEPIDPRYYQDVFHRFLKKADVKQTNVHALRHTFATRALEQGFDLKTLADILGHAEPSTTLNMYSHSFTAHKRKLMAAFNPTEPPVK